MKFGTYYFQDLPQKSLVGKTILLDVDGTLLAEHEYFFNTKTLRVLQNLKEYNDVYLCSNAKDKNRVAKVSGALGMPYINGDLRKPNPAIIKKLPHAHVKPIVVLGDKFLFDGIFAFLVGGEFFKVKRLVGEKDPTSVQWMYAIDDVVWQVMSILALMRWSQWIKNLLVVAPLFFAGLILAGPALVNTLVAVVVFCVISSAAYIFNDIRDLEHDKRHPIKRNRALASGRVSITTAWWTLFTLLIIAILGVVWLPAIGLIIDVYIILNILYSFGLKHIAVLDLVLIATFYILRIVAGGAAADVYLSPWIILCVFFGSLFIILGKRRGEFEHSGRRPVLESYSKQSLDVMLAAAASLATIAYGIYTIVAHDVPNLVFSTIFVAFALFRLLNDIYVRPHDAETPELLVFKDKWILLAFGTWLVYVFLVFYV